MDRNRESRRASIVGSNGFNRRRYRTNSVRDSPDEDGGLELQESVRLRERVKKYPDRERERERDRERYRERERDLRERSSRIKRRRAERLASHKDDTGGDDTSDESLNDDEDDEYEENVTSTIKMLSPAVGSVSNHQVHVGNHHHHNHSHSSGFSQQQHNSNSSSNILINSSHHLQHRKTFPPISSSSSAKVLRAPPVWKSGDEMISVSVPRKARSASTKRSHDWISSTSNNNSSGGVSGGADQIPAQPTSSPARPTHMSASTAPPAAADPPSPSSSNASIRKKLKHSANNTAGPKPKPPKVSALSSKLSSSHPEELEIEIAEVLYGLMTQSQGPSSSNKEEPREVNHLSIDAKSRNSSPISNSTSNNNTNNNSMNNLHPGPNSGPLSAVAQTRKRPRQVPERSTLGARTKPETDETSDNKMLGSAGETASEAVGINSVISQDSTKSDLELKPSADEFRESRDWVVGKEDVSSSKEQESPAVRGQDTSSRDSPSVATASSAADTPINGNLPGVGVEKEEKFEIDLMAPPTQARSSPERETNIDLSASTIVDRDMNHVTVSKDNDNDKAKSESGSLHSLNVAAEEKKSEESESNNKAIDNKGRDIDLHLDLDKPDKDVVSSSINAKDNKSRRQIQKQAQPQVPFKVAGKEEPPFEKPGHSASSLPLPMQSWPGGLPPMGYMAPLQGVVSMDGSSVAPAHLQPLFSQPRPKRCATHCHIARNIHCLQQFMKMNPFWPAPTGSPASLFGSKPCNFNVGSPVDLSIAARGVSSLQDKGPGLASAPNNVGKDKSSQPANSSDSAQKKQQILIQQALPQALPPVAPSNLLGPTFIFPLNQQQAATVGKSTSTVSASNMATTSSSAPATAMSFSYPNMSPSETTQYLAILQNNAFPPFPIPTVGAPPNYRGGAPTQPMPLFNGPFYSSQIINHHQSQQHLPPPNQPQFHHNASAPNNSSSGKHMQQRPPQSGGAPSLQQNSSSSHKSHASHNNLSLPIQPQNFALMTTPPVGLGAAGSNQNEKKSHQQSQHQQQIMKSGVETLPPHTFAMSFGPINVTPAAGPGIDKAAVVQNQAMFQTFSDATRQSVQMMPVDAQTTQKLIRISEEGKPGNVDLPREDERKSFAFSRSTDMANGPATSCSVQGITVIDSSSASMNSNSSGTSPQSPQWKNSARTPASQAQGPSSLGPSGVSMHKNISQQHSRTQQPMHTQISFGGTQKQSLSSQGQQQIAPSSGNQVGSPTTSSISKGAMSGSPRTPSSASTNNKTGQGSSFSTQQTKNSPSMPNQKSPSILGNPHAAKNQLQQQQSQPKTMQQAQLFFSSPYSPSHPHHSTGSANAAVAGPSGYYMTQRRSGSDQHQRGPGGATLMSSSGVLSLCTPVSLSNASTNDPTTAIATATCNAKGGGFQSQGMMHVSPFGAQSSAMLLPAGFSYIHPVPAGVQVKPAEQKQPAGNDNLHPWQPEKK
ncbi:Protein TIME FOR COFFEE [Striga hermonthica]|uniref:Protein TIME FOR COFFEE n=1 Tax=Striga hermonthica TaxID=68872 RepID=A0A9N7R3U4_STRHE|nr:Protein TIME FOR COFFEE [Striga hermonthica]